LEEYVLPNLFIPGAAKSGTSTLHNLLNQHPDIYMSKIKEPHFFSWDEQFKKGIRYYSKLFEEGKKAKYRGESTTGYMVFPNVIERLKNIIQENPKFIFILRNPIDRAYSHYWWLKGMGFEEKDFKEAFLYDIDEEPDPNNRFSGNYKYYYQFGLYGKWLLRFYENFPKENIFIITTEQLRENQLDTLNKCFKFLDVKPLDSLENVIENETVILKNPKLYGKFSTYLRDRERITFIRKGVRTILPSPVRGKIFNFLNNKIEKFKEKNIKSKSYPKLTKEKRDWIKEFYVKDVDLLKKITKKDFYEWNDFNE
jgi:hypothetical protein